LTYCSWVLALGNGGLIQNETGRLVFIAAIAATGAILALVIEPHVIRCATAIGGAFDIALGVDMFTNTGFKNAVTKFLGDPKVNYQTTTGVYILAACAAVLAISGILFQYRHFSNSSSQNKGGR
jgi:hypothetical protein